jgi:anti-sigma regulatory factor (Ser/Thr protein kinase)
MPSSVPIARHLLREDLLARRLPARLIDDCLVVVSELVANAIRHARPFPAADGSGRLRLGWSVTREQVWIAVTDGGGPGRPHVESPSLIDIRGRGLAIVDAIADEWGVTGPGPEVTVYAVVRS